jgi:hypothetical protein
MLLLSLPSSGLATAWGVAMAFDILIFGMTVYKSFTTYRRIMGQRLIDIVLRDGVHQHSFSITHLMHPNTIDRCTLFRVSNRNPSTCMHQLNHSRSIMALVHLSIILTFLVSWVTTLIIISRPF